jgi:hypothetical protein
VIGIQGDHAKARALQEESLALNREVGDKRGVAAALNGLGAVARFQGDHATARVLYEENLALRRELGDKRGIIECLAGLAGVAQGEGQPQRAAKLLGAVEALPERVGIYLTSFDRVGFERMCAVARAQLDEATFVVAWAAGRAMTMEQAIAEALAV